MMMEIAKTERDVSKTFGNVLRVRMCFEKHLRTRRTFPMPPSDMNETTCSRPKN